MPSMLAQEEMLERMRDILGEDFLVLKAVAYQLEEDFDTGEARITCKVINVSENNEVLSIKGQATGLVDACFNGMLDTFAEQYPSLRTISFNDFEVKGLMSTGDGASSNAEGEVSLTVLSSEDMAFTFKAQSRSIGRASVDATVAAVSYFINSERAFIRTYNSLQHYRQTGRPELVTKYQLLLGQMVQNTSYTEVIEQIKASELNKA